jgi:hypothetical protein
MPALSRIAALHGALWNVDPWYRRSWYVGPASMALMVCGWIVAQPLQPAKWAGIPWAVPIPRPAPAGRPGDYGPGTLAPDIAKHFAPPGWKPPVAATAAPPAATAGATSARRAVLHEDDATDPKGRSWEGSVDWRTDQTAGTDDQPKQLAIKADIELPGEKIKMTLTIRRNTDASLPASHLAELSVTVPPDFPGGGIASVQGISMKPNEQAKDIAFAATAAKVNDGLFLIGLLDTDAGRSRNMLLEEDAWFDIAVVYNNQRHATITLEKGETGDRVFREAFEAWPQ